MSDDLVVRYASPTLAGLKTANMFTCPCSSRKALLGDVAEVNKALVPKGLRLIPLKFNKGRVLLYLYRPKFLERDLKNEEAIQILKEAGYRDGNIPNCLKQIIQKLNNSEEFPHEIGLFLGYPAEDVRGFMSHKNEGCKCIGTWRVYGNEEEAKRKFASYRKCTSVYCRYWEGGATIGGLAVSV